MWLVQYQHHLTTMALLITITAFVWLKNWKEEEYDLSGLSIYLMLSSAACDTDGIVNATIALLGPYNQMKCSMTFWPYDAN